MSFPKDIGSALSILPSISYRGALRYYTTQPIADIEASQGDHAKVVRALCRFRKRKIDELAFVQRASALAAAAVIGVFSWPVVEHTIWPAKTCWHCSLLLSLFAMISSAQSRLLDYLPESEDGTKFTEAQRKEALRLVLDKEENGQPDAIMTYLWQSPVMQMSWSWVLFLIGYALHISTPLIKHEEWNGDRKTSTIVLTVGLLIVSNFFLCGIRANLIT